MKLSPYYSKGYYNRAVSKIKLEFYEEAIKDLNKSIELDSKCSFSYQKRGEAKLKLKLYKEAAEDLLKSIELGNSNEDIYFNIGFSYYKLSYFKDALYYFNKVHNNKKVNMLKTISKIKSIFIKK